MYENLKRNLQKLGLLRLALIPFRLRFALGYYTPKLKQIFFWLFYSKEDTNFSYELTQRNLSYLAQVISIVTNSPVSVIEKYLNEPVMDDDLKKYVIKQSMLSEFSSTTDARCDFGRRLGWYAIVRTIKPKIIVETGVDKGLGSVLLCYALKKNTEEGFSGRYFGTDINPTAGFLLQDPYKKFGEILYGDSIESLKNFKNSIDVFINDSSHSGEYEYNEYLAIEQKLSDKSIILGDNSHSTDKLLLFSKKTGRNFLFFKEEPKNHWYPGGGIGISFK